MKLKIPKIKKPVIIIAGAIVGVFVLYHVMNKFSARVSAKGQKKIRMFRGRSNFSGTRLNNKRSMRNLSGNRSQKKLSSKAIRLMSKRR